MSKINISENLFMEVAEFKNLIKFLDDEGFKRHFLLNTDSFGLIRQANIPNLGNITVKDNFYVSKAGTPTDDVIINKGLAVDFLGNLILNNHAVNLKIPNDSLWYIIKIKHKTSNKEKGNVSVDSLGNVVGFNTEFTKIFRGQPNFPTKIKFLNSENGNAENYEVVRVLDDNNMILQGNFVSESKLDFAVHGTFTPGFVPDDENRLIYNHDSVEIILQREGSRSSGIEGQQGQTEFIIARVRNNGINLSLEDRRFDWWQSEATKNVKDLRRNLDNPLIGVEAVKWDIPSSTRFKNWVELAFGFRFSTYTIDTSSKRISILIGNGGVYKNTSDFQNGDFNGWRLYSKKGTYQTIVDSIKTGTQIVITLDVLIPDDYGISDLLFVAPPFEEIEVRVKNGVSSGGFSAPTSGSGGYNNLEKSFLFPINTPIARFEIASLSGCYLYNFTYRFKTLNDYTDWLVFPDDNVGYWTEKSFDNDGNLNVEPIDRERKPYQGDIKAGFIKICEHSNSFNNFQNYIDTGDLFGVRTLELSNSEPVVQLEVGVDKQYQHFKGADLSLTGNIFIHLKRKRDVNGNPMFCREGNKFIIHIQQFINLSGFKIRIVEDYQNPTEYTLIAELDANDIAYIKNNTNQQNLIRRGLFITCTFNNLNRWVAHYDTEVTPKGTVRILDTVPADSFNALGEGVKQGFYGWQIINAMNDRFPMGSNSVAGIGQTGGDDKFTLNLSNIPPHKHTGVAAGPYNGTDIGGGFKGGDNNFKNRPFTTENAGGSSGTTQPVLFKPKFYKFVFIKKIV